MCYTNIDYLGLLNHGGINLQEAEATEASSKAGGLLSLFVRNIGMNVMGTQSLALEDIQPALEQLKKKLMERNVAEEIAAK